MSSVRVHVHYIKSLSNRNAVFSRIFQEMPRVGEYMQVVEGHCGEIKRIEWDTSGSALITVLLPRYAEIPSE